MENARSEHGVNMFVDEKREGEITVIEPWRQVLFGAADFLENKFGGWCQRYLMDWMGQVCLIGAITTVPQTWQTPMGLRDYEVRHHAHYRMNKFLGMPAHSWNDALGRTKEEVVDALRNCARSK
jgi:hypothetical protein